MPTQYREAKAEEKVEKRSYRKLHHVEIEHVKGENGGHIVTHHYHNDLSGGPFKRPEVHMFGKDGKSSTGEHMFEHLGRHLKVSLPTAEPGDTHEGEKEEHEGPTSKVQAASEPISEDVEA
jgi:hypothetical protein